MVDFNLYPELMFLIVTGLMLIIIIYSVGYRLPRALKTIDAIHKASTITNKNYSIDAKSINIPETWNPVDGNHLFITEDSLLLCRPSHGEDIWDLVDIDRIIKTF